jgi:hypothetical protein
MNAPGWAIAIALTLFVGLLSYWVRARRSRRHTNEEMYVQVDVRHAVIVITVGAALLVLPILIIGLVLFIWITSQ